MNAKNNTEGALCRFKGQYSGTEYLNPFTYISDNKSLIFYTYVAIHGEKG